MTWVAELVYRLWRCLRRRFARVTDGYTLLTKLSTVTCSYMCDLRRFWWRIGHFWSSFVRLCGGILFNMPKYSVVVPFHNEEEYVTTLYDRLKDVMEQVGDSFELVFVDDGSSDRTYKLLEEIAAVDSRVLVVKLRRNFGQTSALAAGFD